jgi:predicted PurR-regulated permease PerM
MRRYDVGHGGARLLLAGVAAAIVLFILWMASHAILIVFAGVLFGVLLDACVRGLGYLLPLSRVWLLTIVCVAFLACLSLLLLTGGIYVFQELDYLRRLLNEQISMLREQAIGLGLDLGKDEDRGGLIGFLTGDPAAIVGPATTALTTLSSVILNSIIIFITGIFAAANPTLYRDGVARLFPVKRRARITGALDEVGSVLRWWLLGQVAAMALIGLSVTIALTLLGVPAPMLLGLQAGLLSFVPFVGPILGGVPIGLAAMQLGLFTMAMTLLAYTIIQSIEGYLLTPLIQDRVVHLPPLLTIAAILVFAAIFGEVSVAVATPLVAAARVLVLRLYIEDELESAAHPATQAV